MKNLKKSCGRYMAAENGGGQKKIPKFQKCSLAKGTDLYYGILLEVGRWWWSSISMMTNLTIGGLVVMNFSRSLLLMTTLFLVFAKRLCSLFPEFSFYFVLNSKVDQLSRKQQKKKSWAEKRNVTKILPFDKHLIHQRFVL